MDNDDFYYSLCFVCRVINSGIDDGYWMLSNGVAEYREVVRFYAKSCGE